MQANVRIKAKEDVDKQKEKERKREGRELRKIAAANGVKMSKIPSSTLAAVPVAESSSLATAPGMGMSMSTDVNMDIDGGNLVAEPKTGGWVSLSASQGSGGFKKSGWATIGPSSSSNSLISFQSTSATDQQPTSAPTALSSITTHHNPTFRNAGWSSLDTSSSHPTSSSHGGDSRPQGLTSSTGSGKPWQGTEPTDPIPPPPPPPPEPALQSLPPMPPVPKPAEVPHAKPPRSNWQQFQKGTGRRK